MAPQRPTQQNVTFVAIHSTLHNLAPTYFSCFICHLSYVSIENYTFYQSLNGLILLLLFVFPFVWCAITQYYLWSRTQIKLIATCSSILYLIILTSQKTTQNQNQTKKSSKKPQEFLLCSHSFIHIYLIDILFCKGILLCIFLRPSNTQHWVCLAHGSCSIIM